MDRIINIKVSGNHLTKDGKNAGTRGEANVTILRITFDKGWDGYSRHIVFWDAHGMNPTKISLLDNAEATNIFEIAIPPEAKGLAGELTFTIEGYKDEKRQIAVSTTLEVEDALIDRTVPIEPTPDQITQLNHQYESMRADIQQAMEARDETETYAQNAKESAGNAEDAKKIAEEFCDRAEEAESGAQEAQSSTKALKEETTAQADRAQEYGELARQEAAKAQQSALNSEESASDSKQSATNAQQSEENALQSATSAAESAIKAQRSEDSALNYKNVAMNYASEAIEYERKAHTSANNAEASAERAENTLGKTNYIGENGNWFAWDSKKNEFYDTGVNARVDATEISKIKESLPAILTTTKVYEEEINSDIFLDIPLYNGTKYKVEVWKGNELLGSITDIVKNGGFGNANYETNPEQPVGGLGLGIYSYDGDRIKICFVGVGGEYCVRIYSIEVDVDPSLDSRLDSRYVQQIDSIAENPVWFKDLTDGIYALRGVFGGGVRLFDNETYSFAILRRDNYISGIVHLLHTNDFVTFYNTTILSGGDVPIHEPAGQDIPALVEQAISANANLLTREKDVAIDPYSASDDSLLTSSQINGLIAQKLERKLDKILTASTLYPYNDGSAKWYFLERSGEEGGYFIAPNHLLSTLEDGLCFVYKKDGFNYATFICASGIKFFDHLEDDLWDMQWYSTDNPHREIPFTNSYMQLMSPNGTLYKVTVDDDGQLTATPNN